MGSIITPTRRGFLAGLGTALAMPFIVKASSIMPVKSLPPEMLKNPARKWHLINITRGGPDITIVVDGQIVPPDAQQRGGWAIDILSHKLRVQIPPQGSYQQYMLREYA